MPFYEGFLVVMTRLGLRSNEPQRTPRTRREAERRQEREDYQLFVQWFCALRKVYLDLSKCTNTVD